MCRAKKLIMFLLFNVCAFSFALHSSASYALDLTTDVNLVRGNMSYTFACTNCSNQSMDQDVKLIWNANQDLQAYIRVLTILLPNEAYVPGDFLTIDLYTFNNLNNNSSDIVAKSFSTNTNGWDIVDITFETISASSGVVHITLRNFTAGTYNSIILASTTSAFANLQYNEYLAAGIATHWRSASPDYSTNFQSVINAINSQPTYTSQLNAINNNVSELQQTMEQANDDANDRYQDEKDTIQDNADNSVDSWEDAQQNLTFEEPTWLLSWFWSLGTTEQCINIPVLASLIHSNETTYCSWWDTTIRSIVSPIVNIFLVCIVSGFIIKWLRSSGI